MFHGLRKFKLDLVFIEKSQETPSDFATSFLFKRFLTASWQISIRHIDRYLKNGASKSIAHIIRHANITLYKVHVYGFI